jgi:hypothetical protein
MISIVMMVGLFILVMKDKYRLDDVVELIGPLLFTGFFDILLLILVGGLLGLLK